MHPAAQLQFERIVDEYGRWRAIPESERPPAPAWWWGPAFELRESAVELPPQWSARLRLATGASYAAGAAVLRNALAGQTYLPWPYDFSRMVESADSDVRDLPIQPSDDSAFPP